MAILTEIHQVTTWQLVLLAAVAFFFGSFMQGLYLPWLAKKLEKKLENRKW